MIGELSPKELRDYYNLLVKYLKRKTGLNFDNFYISLYPNSVEVVRLEQFIHKNKLGDTVPMYKDFIEKNKAKKVKLP